VTGGAPHRAHREAGPHEERPGSPSVPKRRRSRSARQRRRSWRAAGSRREPVGLAARVFWSRPARRPGVKGRRGYRSRGSCESVGAALSTPFRRIVGEVRSTRSRRPAMRPGRSRSPGSAS